MHIAIDVTPGVASRAGIGRYALELARELEARERGISVHPFSCDPARRHDPTALRNAPWIDRPRAPRLLRVEVAVREVLGLAADSWFRGCEVFHATDHLLPPLRRVASVFTLHDLTCFQAPETQTTFHRTYSRLMLGRFLAHADIVIAISESTRRDALERFALDPERVRTIPLATPRGFAPAPPEACLDVRARHGLPRRYLLSVGTIEPRKNHGVLFQALADTPPELRLVIVGRRGWRSNEVFATLAAAGVADRVIMPGFVPDADLPAVYSGACGFLFPSLYEGFGIPVLEALACGVPVAASDTSSLPEVLGEAGWSLPPRDVAAWRDAMLRFWNSDPASSPLRSAGLERAARFGWNDVLKRTVDAYREAHARRH